MMFLKITLFLSDLLIVKNPIVTGPADYFYNKCNTFGGIHPTYGFIYIQIE